MARATGAPLVEGDVTRLLVDLNRTPAHPRLFAGPGATLDAAGRREVLRRHYAPYRRRLQGRIRRALAGGVAVHLSVHSFTPRLRGIVRDVDVGLLFDPGRPLERTFFDAFGRALARRAPRLRIRRNRPYPGKADGFVTEMREAFPPRRYVGLELEVNQRFPRAGGPRWRRLQGELVGALLDALAAFTP